MPKPHKVIVTKPAKADLTEIWNYIALQLKEPNIADNIIDMLIEKIESLHQMPKRCATVQDEQLALRGCRKLPVKSYIILFTVDDKSQTVKIIRILYGKRDWVNIL